MPAGMRVTSRNFAIGPLTCINRVTRWCCQLPSLPAAARCLADCVRTKPPMSLQILPLSSKQSWSDGSPLIAAGVDMTWTVSLEATALTEACRITLPTRARVDVRGMQLVDFVGCQGPLLVELASEACVDPLPAIRPRQRGSHGLNRPGFGIEGMGCEGSASCLHRGSKRPSSGKVPFGWCWTSVRRPTASAGRSPRSLTDSTSTERRCAIGCVPRRSTVARARV